MKTGFLFSLASFAMLGAAPMHEPYLAVVRQESGEVRVLGQDTSIATGIKQGDVIPPGQTMVTGENGLSVLRFHPDFTRIEARAKTRYWLNYSRSDSSRARRIKIEDGQIALAVQKNSPDLFIEDTHSWARAKEARFLFSANAENSTLIVLDGSVEVNNRAKSSNETVRRGQKAVSDVNGLRISDAADSELQQAGLRQNILEVDFMNSTNEDFSTLEVEYESTF
ncbi:MAG TPA: hypothetical protein DCQ83_08230 [Fibrobacteres bacterium]|jgi:hypothetical protein|nr:hypothetical protein [Fibrobacterota bacterium]